MEHLPLSRRERGQLWLRMGIRGVLVLAVFLLAVHAVPPLLSLMAPFLLALAAAWLLNPAVRWLQRKLSLSRKVLSVSLMILILCAIGGVLYGVIRLALGQLRSLLENWRSLVEEVLDAVDRMTAWLSRLLPPGLLDSSRLTEWLREIDLSGRIAALAERAPALVTGMSGFAVAAAVFVMAAVLITGEYPRLRFSFTDRVPADIRAFFGTVRTIFMKALGGYLKSQLLLTLGVFVILTAGFLVVGQPYSLLLAAGLAVLDLIPLVGTGVVLLPWAAVELIGGGWAEAAGLAVIWGLTVVFRRVAEPKILGGQTGLSPILSLVGIYVGMKLGGVIGMIAGPLLLLVAVNLGKLGVFRPAVADLRCACRDVMSVLKAGRDDSE